MRILLRLEELVDDGSAVGAAHVVDVKNTLAHSGIRHFGGLLELRRWSIGST